MTLGPAADQPPVLTKLSESRIVSGLTRIGVDIGLLLVDDRGLLYTPPQVPIGPFPPVT